MQRKRFIKVTKKLRCSRILTVNKAGTFFVNLAPWLVKPSHVLSLARAV